MNQQDQNLLKIFNFANPIPKKILYKKQTILLSLPLFLTIYQKKGEQNFSLITQNIKLQKYQFGQTIFGNFTQDQQSQSRLFNYLLKGVAMMFTIKQSTPHKQATFYKKIGPNDYFGQKLSFGTEKLSQVKAVSACYVLRLDLTVFYNTFSGHFQYAQLKDKVIFLQNIWIFNHITRPNIQRILLMSQSVKYKKGKVLFSKHQISEVFYIILSGEIALFQQLTTEKVKYVPFCLLSRGQICGLQEIALQINYAYSGVVSSQSLQIMIISKDTYLKCIQPNIPKNMNTIQRIYDQKLNLKSKSIKYDKEYKQVCEYSRKKQRDIFKFFIKKFIPQKPCIQVQKVQLNHRQQLKTPLIREFRLKQIRQRQHQLYKKQSLSTLTNNNYTIDKKLLINYLMKKQKSQKLIYQNQRKFQRSMSMNSGVMHEMRVNKSSAVKNHKRKLINSRNHTSMA